MVLNHEFGKLHLEMSEEEILSMISDMATALKMKRSYAFSTSIDYVNMAKQVTQTTFSIVKKGED